MLPSNEESSVHIEAFARDLYLLSALILSRESMAQLDLWSQHGSGSFSAEAGRLLILTAVAARQMMDALGGGTGDVVCGQYCADLSRGSRWRQLRFRRACNSIIHSLGIEGEPPSAELPEGLSHLIRVRGRDYGRGTEARLDGLRYIRCGLSLLHLYGERQSRR